MPAVVLLLGLAAGALTTLAGAGGGVLLILSLSLLVGPHVALAATAPALLVGNAHRVALYRDRVDRGIALRVVAGALPGSLIGGAFAVSLPTAALRSIFFVIAVYAVARAFGFGAWSPPRVLLTPAGALLGGISATSGGAGLLGAPLLLSTGLTGERYIATSAAIALATHVGRLTAYGARGMLSREVLAFGALATVALIAGNGLGDRLRPLVSTARRRRIVEFGTLAACCTLAVVGLI